MRLLTRVKVTFARLSFESTDVRESEPLIGKRILGNKLLRPDNIFVKI